MEYTVILEPQEEGGYTVQCLEIPGAISQGDTKEEALENITEAIQLVLEVIHEDAEKHIKINHAELSRVEVANVA